MNGYTIRHISDEGIYYMVKQWRKNQTIWVEHLSLKQEYLYGSEMNAIHALEKLLNVMPEYITGRLDVVLICNDIIQEHGNLSIENLSSDEWNPCYRATISYGNVAIFKLGDIVEILSNPYSFNKYAVVTTSNGSTVGYMSCLNRTSGGHVIFSDQPKQHLNVVGHLNEYDEYYSAVYNLQKFNSTNEKQVSPNEIRYRFASALHSWDSELDFYMDLLESNITISDIRQAMGDKTANMVTSFLYEHGLI